jgi:hypothetical protein
VVRLVRLFQRKGSALVRVLVRTGSHWFASDPWGGGELLVLCSMAAPRWTPRAGSLPPSGIVVVSGALAAVSGRPQTRLRNRVGRHSSPYPLHRGSGV